MFSGGCVDLGLFGICGSEIAVLVVCYLLFVVSEELFLLYLFVVLDCFEW